MNRRNVIILVVILAAIVLPLFVAAIVGTVILVSREKPFLGGQVALIRIEGVITAGRGSASPFGEATAGAETIVSVLEQFRKDRSVKSAVIRINSPGGSAAGSQEVYQEINRVRKDGKKITVSMGDVAASGGYYIASAADRIIADPATLTGSIGVIMQTADMSKLLEKIGISYGTIKSGPHKDMGSISRPLTPEEKALLQGMINDVYDQFLTDVAAGRKIPKAEVRKIADGRIFTGRQAKKIKLVDRLGSLDDAMRAAADDAGIKGEYSVKEYQRPLGLFEVLFGTSESRVPFGQNGALGELARRLLQADSGVKVD
jgi:protease-4